MLACLVTIHSRKCFYSKCPDEPLFKVLSPSRVSVECALTSPVKIYCRNCQKSVSKACHVNTVSLEFGLLIDDGRQ